MYRYLTKLNFTGGNTASKCRLTRKTRRSGGAFSMLLLLVFATAMLLHTSVARAVDIFEAKGAATNIFCQLSSVTSNDVFKLPELGGSYSFSPTGSYMEGPTAGAARLTGVIVGGSPVSTFAVDLLLDGRLNEGDVGYDDAVLSADFLLREPCGSLLGWHFYTELSGTVTGTSGLFDGAVYKLTPRGNLPQVGFGANTHNTNFGAFAKINFELDNPLAFPSFPVGPFAGEMGMDIRLLGLFGRVLFVGFDNFPTASPNLMGTWEGVIECAGMLDFTEEETFSSSMTLKVGPVVGRYHSARLSNPQGVVASYCATYLNNLRGGQINTGFMFNSVDPDMSKTLLKVSKDDSGTVTLKAREVSDIPDGLDVDGFPEGLEVCKWSFTQIDTNNPGIANACEDLDGDGVLFVFDRCLGFDDFLVSDQCQ